jgi:hypothetical protein
MFGTLIGIFVTSTAIVIGADSAISGKEGYLGELNKTCKTSSRSIATIQGEYGIPYAFKKNTPDYLRQAFMESCKKLSLARRIPLQAQADSLVEAVHSTFQANIGKMSHEYLNGLIKGGSHVNYISVSGYENGKPQVMVHELRLTQAHDGHWMTEMKAAPDLAPRRCGAKFHGERIIAGPLVNPNSGNNLPFPLINLSRPEVMAAREANRSGNCSEFTQGQAEALYETAVCLTIQIGPAVGLRSGIVGGALQLWTIPIEGDAKLAIINKSNC